MRIEQFQPRSLKPAEGDPPADKPAQAESHLPTGAPSDQAGLSCLSQVLSGGIGKSTRIEQLRAAVVAGAYQVPAAELSRRLADFHLTGTD